MTCAALAAVVGAVTLSSAGYNAFGTVQDQIVLAPSDEVAAEVCYHNSHPPTTRNRTVTLTIDHLTVDVRTEVGQGGPDTATITPPPGYIASPPSASVEDGGTVFFMIEWAAS